MLNRRISFWQAVLICIWIAGFYATIIRFTRGLGAATSLSDMFPWGLWIGFDVLVGVGLAAGGFVITATVYVFNLKDFKAIARPTILTAFLGYLLVIVALMFDLGHPYRILHPIIMWNPHSVMFEVGWCVMLYSTVLFLEFSPLLLQKLGLEKPLRWIRSITIPLVIVGVLLSTLHQSSLGTLYVIAADKLHPLWYSGMLPVLFFISAIAGGLAMVIFESYLSARAFGKELKFSILARLSRPMIVVLGMWLFLRFHGLLKNGALHLVLDGSEESFFFLLEIGLGAILPIILLTQNKICGNRAGLFFTSVLVLMGFILNRLNVSVTGMASSSGVSYFPSWMELAVTASIVGLGFALFGLAAKYLSIFSDIDKKLLKQPIVRKKYAAPLIAAGRDGVRAVSVLGALLVLSIIGLGLGLTNKKADDTLEPESKVVDFQAVSEGITLPKSIVFEMGEHSPGSVTFSHETHVTSEEPNCESCHRSMFKILPEKTGAAGSVSMELLYEGKQCGACHNGNDAFGVEEDCEFCHVER